MNRRAGMVVGVLVLVGVVAGLVAWMGGPGALFGSGDRAPDDAPTTAPEAATATAGARMPGAAGEKTRAGAVLFGRPRAQRKGVGGLALRVLRWKDQSPVEEAVVRLIGLSYEDARVEVQAKTDARGVTAWTDLPAGDAYVLRVEATGEPETAVPGVDVEAGGTRDLGVIYVGKKSALSGRVVDEQGKGVAGAEVRAYPGYGGLFDLLTNFMDLFVSLDKEPTPLAKAETDAKGAFTIPDLSPGPLLLRATSPGKRQAVTQVKLGSDGPIGGPPTLTLEGGAPVAGLVVEASGTPIPGARVSLMSEEMNDPGSIFLGRSFTTTDERGAFRLRVAEDAKRLRAFVAANGFPTAVSKTIAAGDEAVRIVVSAGATLEVQVLETEGSKPIPGATVMLGVSDAEGGPDMSAGGGLVTGTTDDRGTVTLNAPPGAIEMAMVSAPGHGAGMASPRAKGDAAAMGPFGSVSSDLPDKLEAGKTAHATFRLAGGYVLKGRVLDPAGHGIAGAEVKSSSIMGMGGGPISTRSDSEGRYRLAGVTATSVMLSVGAPGWVQREADRMAYMSSRFSGGKPAEAPAPGSEVERDFTLYPSVTVRGRVVDEKDEPVAGAQVGVADAFGLSALFGGKDAEAVTGADGGFVLYDLDPAAGGPGAMAAAGMDGTHAAPAAPEGPKKMALRARADGYVSGKCDPFEVGGGGTVSAPPIRLGRGAVIAGRVLDAGGHAVGNAKVEVSKKSADEDPMQAMRDMMSGKKTDVLRADADGAFRVDTLPKGTVTLTVSAEGHAAARRTVEVGDAPLPPLEVRLAPGQALSGRVVDRDGRPIAGARVSVTGPETQGGDDTYVPHTDGVTKDDGTYSLSPLPAGRMRVSVQAKGKKNATLVLETGRQASDVVLEDRPAKDVSRLAEVKKELTDVREQFGKAGSEADRTALQRRMMELLKEQRELEGGADASGDMPDK